MSSERLPPSAKKVLIALQTSSPITQRQIGIKTGLPLRTVKWAFGKLKANGLISRQPTMWKTCGKPAPPGVIIAPKGQSPPGKVAPEVQHGRNNLQLASILQSSIESLVVESEEKIKVDDLAKTKPTKEKGVDSIFNLFGTPPDQDHSQRFFTPGLNGDRRGMYQCFRRGWYWPGQPPPSLRDFGLLLTLYGGMAPLAEAMQAIRKFKRTPGNPTGVLIQKSKDERFVFDMQKRADKKWRK